MEILYLLKSRKVISTKLVKLKVQVNKKVYSIFFEPCKTSLLSTYIRRQDFSTDVEDAWYKVLHFALKIMGWVFFHSEDTLTPLLARVLLDGRAALRLLLNCRKSRTLWSAKLQTYVAMTSFILCCPENEYFMRQRDAIFHYYSLHTASRFAIIFHFPQKNDSNQRTQTLYSI